VAVGADFNTADQAAVEAWYPQSLCGAIPERLAVAVLAVIITTAAVAAAACLVLAVMVPVENLLTQMEIPNFGHKAVLAEMGAAAAGRAAKVGIGTAANGSIRVAAALAETVLQPSAFISEERKCLVTQ
jgi:hypothetical protein